MRCGGSFGGGTCRQRCSSAADAASHAALFSTIRTLACHRFPVLCDVLRDFAPCAQHWACVALTGFCACPDGCAPTRERVLERAVLPVARPRASFIAFVPYTILVAALIILLVRTYPLGAILFSFYCIYLIYAINRAYHLWRLNTPNA